MLNELTINTIKFVLAASLFMSNAVAENSGNLQLHGFASQAIIHTSENQFFGTSDDTSFEFTELGLGSSIVPYPGLHAAIQVGTRAAGRTAEIEDVQLDFAVLDYSTPIGNSTTNQIGLRVGRFRNPVGLHNETRDVLSTRPGVMLPQSSYFDALGFRNFFVSSDGVLLHTSKIMENVSWALEVFASNPRDSADGTKTELIGTPQLSQVPGKLSSKPLYGGRATFELNQQLKVALTGLKYSSDYNAIGAPSESNLGDGKIHIDYTMLSLAYEREFLSASSEFVIAGLNRSGFSPSPRASHGFASGYVRLDYRATDRVTPFVTYGRYVYERDDPNGAKFETASGGFIPGHYLYQRDATLGAKWSISRHWYAAAEYHYVEGTSLLSALDNPNIGGSGSADDGPVGGHKYWTMATAMISYHF